MTKTARRMRVKNRINTDEKTDVSQYSASHKTQIISQTYDAYQYIKSDMKWSALVGGIVILALIITYIFLH
jgi:hypothetical protein